MGIGPNRGTSGLKDSLNRNRGLDEAFRRAFDNVFRVFGEGTRETLLAFMEENYSLSREKLAARPDLLYQVLEEAFHAGGGLLIKRMLLREFYRELGIALHDDDGRDLSEHLEGIRTRLEMRGVTSRP